MQVCLSAISPVPQFQAVLPGQGVRQPLATPQTMPQPAAAGLLAPLPPPAAPGPGNEEAAQRLQTVQTCLAAEAARAAAALQAAEARTATARASLEQGCSAAQQQQEGIATALTALAARLGRLAPAGAGAVPPLLSLDLPDAYARACTQLLELLAGYVQHHIDSSSCAPGGGGGAPTAAEQQEHRRRALELEQLQGGTCKAERLRVQEEAEEARWVPLASLMTLWGGM